MSTCKRDVVARDRDETETFGFQSETRPRPSHTLPRPRRDRDVWKIRLETATSRPRLQLWWNLSVLSYDYHTTVWRKNYQKKCLTDVTNTYSFNYRHLNFPLKLFTGRKTCHFTQLSRTTQWRHVGNSNASYTSPQSLWSLLSINRTIKGFFGLFLPVQIQFSTYPLCAS